MTESNKYQNDKHWQELATWGKDLGLSTWGKEIVNMSPIHSKLFMGSRLSAQEVIDKGILRDQHNRFYTAKHFHCICVASENTCAYCSISPNHSSFDIKDRAHEDDAFLQKAVECAKKIRKKLKWGKYTLVHCHSGRNRSALVILIYCAMYTTLTYEEALYTIRKINSFRFSMQSTLQNTSFTSHVRLQWDNLKKHKSLH